MLSPDDGIYVCYHKDVATHYLRGFPVNNYALLILIMARPSSVEVGGITWGLRYDKVAWC
ncbi:hypothetical protein [Nitrosomonas supralitoralis]|uniref:hypothetical protein n=1 Tax=Nitrosomonas supralitoralis TaxID=2116706 RepID=UPI0011C3C6B5|nr:hypothetical protein [Nitrosomonas supralitoralis]